MKIKVGDRVKFLNDTGSGEVTRIMDAKTALVQVEGGFEVPWMIRDLVVDEGIYYDEKEEVDSPDQVPTVRESFSAEFGNNEIDDSPIEDEEILLALLPEGESPNFEVYLINSSSYHFKYAISKPQEGELVLYHEGTLEAGVKVNLGVFKPTNVEAEESFRVHGIFYNQGIYVPVRPLDIQIRITSAMLFDAAYREDTDYFIEKVIPFILHDFRNREKDSKMDVDVEALKQAMFTKGDIAKEKKKKENPQEEVDLHIEKLVEDHASMSNAEILDIQVSRFRTALDSAIIHKIRRIVFIHGIGNGKLKHEIRRILEREYSTLRYQDASFKEYGYGATMVILSR